MAAKQKVFESPILKMNSFAKYFTKDLLFNQTLTLIQPFNDNFQRAFHASQIECKAIYLPCIVLFVVFSIKILKSFMIKNGGRRHLGYRSLDNIKYLQDIVIEVHYAACYCGSDSKLIRRCKQLLEMYPAACNIAMHGHQYTPFLRACWNGCAELISYMIRIGANLEATTDAGEGAVYLATYRAIRDKNNDFAAIKILLAAGADINLARSDGLTPLELAILKGHKRLARWLLAHGAAPGGRN